jgi:hypothetical protein
VDRTQRESVDDGGDAPLLDVRDDVGGLKQLTLAQGADRAAVPVRALHLELEALLMQPLASLAGGVGAHVGARD